MGKTKLRVQYDFDFHLLAINASIKEYTLAWSLNQSLGISLAKQANVEITFLGNKSLSISNYTCKTAYQVFRLLRNRADSAEEQFNAFLIPEMKNFDYFLMVEDESDTFEINSFISRVKEIPFVQFAVTVDAASLKSKDNLIF